MEKHFFLGTYTKKNSKGIYQGTLDLEKKEITQVNFLQKEVSPTYLALSKNNVLYTVGAEDGKGSLDSYTFSNNQLSFLNAVAKEGAAPCYVAVDEKRQLVYSANYHQGTVRSYRIEKNGALTLADEVFHQGSGPHENQEKAHVHYTDLTPNGYLVSCDLGTDEVTTYDVKEDGKLTEIALFKAQPGTGPRHLVFHPNGKYAYLIGELANTLTILEYHSDGHFTEVETLSTLPEDFSDFSAGGAVKISKDGNYVYASNRGHNSIAVFATSEDGGKLEIIQTIPSGGDFPRDFSFDPTGKLLVCAHQKSDELAVFEVDKVSGKLTFLNANQKGPEGVCVVFYD